MSSFYFDPKKVPVSSWKISDDDRSGFPNGEVPETESVISAPWGKNGALEPISFRVDMTFEGLRDVECEDDRSGRVGVFSVLLSPKDPYLIGAFRKRVVGEDSPRDQFKKAVSVVGSFPMYLGARISLYGAHCGEHGMRLYMEFSAVDGWETLVSKREAEIARYELHQRQWLPRLWRWLMRVPPEILPSRLDNEPPADPWQKPERFRMIQSLIEGVGLDGGPLRLAGESMMRRLCRDPRVSPVTSRFRSSNTATIMGVVTEIKPGSRRLNFTIVQL